MAPQASASADHFSSAAPGSFFAVFGIGAVVHLVYLAINYAVASSVLRLPTAERKAVVIVASQKTIPVAMTVLELLPDAVGAKGLVAIPCILSHLVQILIDGVVVARWANTDAPDDGEEGGGDKEANGGSEGAVAEGRTAEGSSGGVELAPDNKADLPVSSAEISPEAEATQA